MDLTLDGVKEHYENTIKKYESLNKADNIYTEKMIANGITDKNSRWPDVGYLITED